MSETVGQNVYVNAENYLYHYFNCGENRDNLVVNVKLGTSRLKPGQFWTNQDVWSQTGMSGT